MNVVGGFWCFLRVSRGFRAILKGFTRFSGIPLMFWSGLKRYHWFWVVYKVTEVTEAVFDLLVCSEAFWGFLMSSEGFLEVLICSLTFWDVLRLFEVLSWILNCSVRFLKVLKRFMTLWCDVRCSLGFWKISEGSKFFLTFWGSEELLNALMCSK